MSQKLPTKITLYCRTADSKGVEHAFPINPDSEKRHETARNWASSRGWGSNSNNAFNIYEYDNKGFDHVVIESLEYRGEGGRAYNVTLHHDGHKFKVDLREDALMDIIKNAGIKAGGRLNGTYAFITGTGQTYLIRENSEAHKRAIAETQRLAKIPTTPIKKGDLKPGYLYETISGEKAIYLGEIYSRSIGSENYNGLNFGKKTKSMMFLRASSKKEAENILNEKDLDKVYYQYDIKASHSYKIEKTKIIDVDFNAIVKNLKEGAEDCFERWIKMGDYKLYRTIESYKLLEMSQTKDLNEDEVRIKRMNDVLQGQSRQRRWW